MTLGSNASRRPERRRFPISEDDEIAIMLSHRRRCRSPTVDHEDVPIDQVLSTEAVLQTKPHGRYLSPTIKSDPDVPSKGKSQTRFLPSTPDVSMNKRQSPSIYTRPAPNQTSENIKFHGKTLTYKSEIDTPRSQTRVQRSTYGIDGLPISSPLSHYTNAPAIHSSQSPALCGNKETEEDTFELTEPELSLDDLESENLLDAALNSFGTTVEPITRHESLRDARDSFKLTKAELQLNDFKFPFKLYGIDRPNKSAQSTIQPTPRRPKLHIHSPSPLNSAKDTITNSSQNPPKSQAPTKKRKRPLPPSFAPRKKTNRSLSNTTNTSIVTTTAQQTSTHKLQAKKNKAMDEDIDIIIPSSQETNHDLDTKYAPSNITVSRLNKDTTPSFKSETKHAGAFPDMHPDPRTDILDPTMNNGIEDEDEDYLWISDMPR